MRKLLAMFMMCLSLVVACGNSDKEDAPRAADADTEAGALSKNGVYRASVQWQESLKANELVQATVTLLTKDGKVPAEAALIAFHPKMPSMGHGTSEVNQVIEAQSSHEFLVKGITFIMGGAAGDWVVEMEATVDGQSDAITVAVPAVE